MNPFKCRGASDESPIHLRLSLLIRVHLRFPFPPAIDSRRFRAISSAMAGTDLVPYDPDKLRRDRARVDSGFWDKLRRAIPRIPFLDEALAAYYCATDPATPMKAKAILYGALAYFILPIDIVPDFILWLGFTDDAAVLYAAIRTVRAHMTDTHRQKARAAIDRLAQGNQGTRSA
jgi:uncharacterized membrane protein YkvA (DUF1232 family)